MNAPFALPPRRTPRRNGSSRPSCVTDFRAFVEYVFGLLRPGQPFKPNWHIDAMAHKVSQVASG